MATPEEQTVTPGIDQPASTPPYPMTDTSTSDQPVDGFGTYPTTIGEWGAVAAAGETPEEKARYERLNKLF